MKGYENMFYLSKTLLQTKLQKELSRWLLWQCCFTFHMQNL